MAEHKHGSMDITTQEKTFENFMSWTVRTTIALLVLAVFLALVAT
jgi:hypothetical protein